MYVRLARECECKITSPSRDLKRFTVSVSKVSKLNGKNKEILQEKRKEDLIVLMGETAIEKVIEREQYRK